MLCLSCEGCKKSMKNAVFFVDLDKAFDRVPKKVLDWATGRKRIPEILVGSLMSVCEGTKAVVSVDSWFSDLFEVKVRMHQGFVCAVFFRWCH